MEINSFSEIMNADNGNIGYFRDLISYGSNRVMPILGAGTSCAVGLPNWSNLLLELAAIDDECKKVVQNHIKEKEFEAAAESIVTMLGINVYRDCLHRIFAKQSIDELNIPHFLRLLPYIFSGPIATLNYDQVIESIFAYIAHLPLSIFIPMDDYQENAIYEALHRNQHILLKLHGSIDNLNSIVLSNNEYNKAYGENTVDYNLSMPRVFKQVTVSRAILFLGCSLESDRFMDILRQISCGHNYALLERPKTQEELSRRRKLLGEYHIFPIWYPNGANKTKVLNLFAEELRIRWNITTVDLKNKQFRSNLDISNRIKTVSGDYIEHAITQLKNNNSQYEFVDYLLRYKNQLEQLNENDIIYFGHHFLCNSIHPREINIRMPIAWIILKKEGSKLLLLSRYCLTWEFYNGPYFCFAPELDITWEKSTIREWMNKEWFDDYFTVEERKLILESDIVTRNNFKFGTDGGGHTKDKLFLLAAEEIPDNIDMKAELQMVDINPKSKEIEINNYIQCWWLRTPGETQDYVAVIDEDGQVDLSGIHSYADEVGIRPAMWIDIDLIDSFFI